MLKEHEKSFSIFQKLLDIIVFATCWWFAYYIRFHHISGAQAGLKDLFIKLTIILVITSSYSFHKNGLYTTQRFTNRYKEILSVVRANTFAMISFVLLLYFFGDERISRLTLLIYFSLSSFFLISFRIGIRNFLRILRSRGKNLRHILLIGNASPLEDYVHAVRAYKDSGIRFLGWIDSDNKAGNFEIPEINQSYDDFKKTQLPDSIVISYKGKDSFKVEDFISSHYNDVVPIQILPDLSYSMVGHQIEEFGGIPLLTVNQPRFSSIELFFKRSFDFLSTLVGVIIISPLLTFLALGVKLSSPGPVLFGQKRIGHDGKEFTMWKFRSMRVADSDTQNQEWSNKDNPRKTRFGDFIRKTSLDELPQLWNVLTGDMSLVGPRPEQPFFVDKFRHEIAGYMLKHKMKPGITGWAQVNGWRGDTSLHKRIECDIFYIKHWSFWFDVKILFLTLFKGFINKNAY